MRKNGSKLTTRQKAELQISKPKPKPVPTEAFLNLYLAVADFVDSGDCKDANLKRAYRRIFRTKWGREKYDGACDCVAKKLKVQEDFSDDWGGNEDWC